MDEAALIIAIVALTLTLAVSGFAILLQWLMFKASSEQLSAIGKENAALGERLAPTLSEISSTAGRTHDAVEGSLRGIVNAFIDSKVPQSADADVPATSGGENLTKRAFRLSTEDAQMRNLLTEMWRSNEGMTIDEFGDRLVPELHGPDADEGFRELIRNMMNFGALIRLNLLRKTTDDRVSLKREDWMREEIRRWEKGDGQARVKPSEEGS